MVHMTFILADHHGTFTRDETHWTVVAQDALTGKTETQVLTDKEAGALLFLMADGDDPSPENDMMRNLVPKFNKVQLYP